MVDAVTIVGTIGLFATVLMVIAMLYLTLIGFRSDRHDLNVETADLETAEVDGEDA